MGLWGLLFGAKKPEEAAQDGRLEALQKQADETCTNLEAAQRKTEHALKAMTEEEASRIVSDNGAKPKPVPVPEEKEDDEMV